MKSYNSTFFTKIICTLLFGIALNTQTTNSQTKNYKINSINCSSVSCILDAMINAQPGDEIIIASGTYTAPEKFNIRGKASRFASENDGTAANPIILRAEDPTNRPILKGPDGIYDGYVLHILGDYWQIENIIFEEGSKGIVFDNANHGTIENVVVRELGEEGIHLRDGSSFNLVKKCKVYNVGIKKPGIGEGLYVGSDKNQHAGPGDENDFSKYNPDCNNNTFEKCEIGPNVTAEGADIKEGTKNTIIYNCTFSAEGISGENSADAFIDLKGSYGFVYGNTFNVDGSTIIKSGVDFLDRGTGYNTGYRNAIFNNILNLEGRGDEIQTARKKQGNPSEIHVWDNTRNPNTDDFPISDGTLDFVTLSCPSWNVIPCDSNENQAPSVSLVTPSTNITLQIGYNALNVEVTASDEDGNINNVSLYIDNNLIRKITEAPYQWGTGANANELLGLTNGLYTIKVQAADNEGKMSDVEFMLTVQTEDTDEEVDCAFGTPINNPLIDYDEASFSNIHVLGTGPDISNIDRFRISWNSQQNNLNRFAINTTDGIPEYYVDLRDSLEFNFNTSQPELTITNSGLTGWDGSYWVTNDENNFVMVSKSSGFTIYFSNSDDAPECDPTLSNNDFHNKEQQIKLYPNPAQQQHIFISGLPKEEVTFEVTDMLGKIVLFEKLDQNEGKIDVSSLKSGMYLVMIKGIKNIESIVFVKR